MYERQYARLLCAVVLRGNGLDSVPVRDLHTSRAEGNPPHPGYPVICLKELIKGGDGEPRRIGIIRGYSLARLGRPVRR